MEKIKNRGQVTIFIIIAIVIVAILILLFVFRGKIAAPNQSINSPQQYIEKCVRDATLEAVNKMMPQGGFVSPMNFKIYQNTKISYLCQNVGNYNSCINQHPALLNEEKQEIADYISPIVDGCFTQLQSDSRTRGEEATFGSMNISVGLAPEKVFVTVDRQTVITRNTDTIKIDSYDVDIDSSLYDLSNVAAEIAANEAKYCYFEYVGYMLLYPKFDIRKFTMSDSTKIYTIEDKQSGSKFNIATRGCAIPPGI